MQPSIHVVDLHCQDHSGPKQSVETGLDESLFEYNGECVPNYHKKSTTAISP